MNSLNSNRKREPQVIFPAQIIENKYVGELKGYYVKNTNSYNVFPFDDAANINEDKIYSIGFILPVNPFRFIDKEIASQIKYLKAEKSTPEEIVQKMQQALQNLIEEPPFKYLKKEDICLIKNPEVSNPLGGKKTIISDLAYELKKYNDELLSRIIGEIDLNKYLILSKEGWKTESWFIASAKLWIKDVFVGQLYLQDTEDIDIETISPPEAMQVLSEREKASKKYRYAIVGYWENGELHFIQLGSRQECKQDKYSLRLDVFSRNTGILESDIMLGKRAMFIGCGSVGSLFALELAKAGVGSFLLIDNDIFGYHNICRHQCGVYDVGRYKTDALAERILQVNPYAKVVTKNMTVQDVPVAELVEFCDKKTIVIGGADNREGDLYANNLAQQIEMPFMSIGCWERAFAGEIFYCLPKNMPNYQDFMEVSGLLSARVNQNRRFYTTEDDLKKVTFEPGISADINFVTIIAVKIALDILNINNENYTQRLLPYLTQYTLVCNTNNKQIGGETAEIFSYPLQVTTSIIVPYSKK